MKYGIRLRWLGGLLLVGGGVLRAQMSSLPPTSSTGVGQPVAVPAATLTPSERAKHAAQVVCAGGKVEVTASNSSLNLILREIARQTGMKITGGVREERVYGRYGPGRPGDVLASLLEGTGSNMLLREGGADGLAELVLTPRTGGVTPPSPNAGGFSDEDLGEASRSGTAPSWVPGQNTFPIPAVTGQAPMQPANPQTPPPTGIIDPPAAPPRGDPGTLQGQPNAPANGAAQPQSPNGVKTPQQIYEQLQQLRQQQQPPQP